MKSIVLYSSLTGSTKKVAQAIAGAVNCKSVNLRKTGFDTIDVNGTDLFFIGSGIYGGTLHPKLKEFLMSRQFQDSANKTEKTIALFSTYGGSQEISERAYKNFKQQISEKGLQYTASFSCPGALFWIIRMNRPNAKDLKNATEWARSIIEQD